MGIIVIPRGGFDLPDTIARHEPELHTVGLWQLFDGYGGTDEGPNGLDIPITGTIPYVPVGVKGKLTEGVAKPTEANYFGFESQTPQLRITGDLTIMNMVRMDAATADLQHMCVFGGPAPDTEPNNILYRWAINTGRTLGYLAEFGAGSNTSVNGGTVLNREQWYHVAMTRTAAGLVTFYVDGVDDGGGATTTPTGGDGPDSIFYIGNGQNAGDDMDGDIGSLHILDRVLSEAEILAEATRLLADWQETLQ